jgi:glycosyltransferase involved in cell wall biosynthesis
MTGDARGRLRALYICYLSLDDPLTHTQVVAYLKGLAAAGHTIHLLTFEARRLGRAEKRNLGRQMAESGIRWHHLRYHKRPSLPATAYDTLAGAAYAWWLSLRFGLNVFHARSHIPAAMAMLARRLRSGAAPDLIFDIRGLMAEEYVDAGRWKRDGLPFRLVKLVERLAIARSAGIVVLTRRVQTQLFGEDGDPRVFVIPCCADLNTLGDTAAARPSAKGQSEAAVTMVYVGKLEGWYMAAEMAEFFAVARRVISNLNFIVLTQGAQTPISVPLQQLGLEGAATISSAPAHEIGQYLAIADFGISFIRPAPSKASSSPTKVGEYLAAGLPVLATSGVGDLDVLLGPGVGVLVADHTDAAYTAAAHAIGALLSDPEVSRRCRDLAHAELSLDMVGIPRYLALYSHVTRKLTSRVDAGTTRA